MPFRYPVTTNSPFMNRSQVDQMAIRSQEEIEANRLNFLKRKYEDILSMYKNAFGAGGTAPGTTVPPEFQEAVSLYRPGGQYGLGTERAIAKGEQSEIASGNIASAMTGMGSSTTAMARTSAAQRSARDARMLAEEGRLRLLGGTLGQAGQASLEAQRIDAARQEALMRSLASLA